MKNSISLVGSGVGCVSILDALYKSDERDFKLFLFSDDHDSAGFAYKESPHSFIMNTRLDSLIQFNHVIDINSWLNSMKSTKENFFKKDSFIPRSIYGKYLLEVSNVLKNKLSQDGIEINYFGHVDKITVDGTLVTASNEIVKTSDIILSMGFGGDSFKENIIDSIYNVPLNDKVTVIGSGLTAVDMIILISELRPDIKIECISMSGRFPRIRGSFSSGGSSIFDGYSSSNPDVYDLFSLFLSSLSNNLEKRIVFDSSLSLKNELEYVEGNNQRWQELLYNGTKDYLDFYTKLPLDQKKIMWLNRDFFINTRAMFPIVNARKLNTLMNSTQLTLKKGRVNLKSIRSKDNFIGAVNTSSFGNFIDESKLPINPICGIEVDYNCKVKDYRNIYALGPITNGCRFFTEASSMTFRDANLVVNNYFNNKQSSSLEAIDNSLPRYA